MDAEGNTSSASNSVTVKVDKTAPKVSEVYPLSGATDVMRNTDIAARFSEEIDPATLTSSAVTLVMDPFSITATNIKFEVYDTKRRKWVSVPHTVSYDATSKTATVSPGSTLAASNQYRVTVTTNVTSRSGVALDQDATTSGNQPKSWMFTTGTS
jgi:Bacterial Ig-like domain